MQLTDLPYWERLRERVWAKIDHTSSPQGCWSWTGRRRSNGYGEVTLCRDNVSFTMAAHRVVYLLDHGQIADGHDCCHSCDNRACCRPDHLFEGTRQENLADMTRKGRRVNTPHRGGRNGHAKLTPAQVGEIRCVLAAGHEKRVSIARRFGISPSNVRWIERGRTWRQGAAS